MKIAYRHAFSEDQDRARDRGEVSAMEADGRAATLAMTSKKGLDPIDRGIDLSRHRTAAAQPLEQPLRARLTRVIEILVGDHVPAGLDRHDPGIRGTARAITGSDAHAKRQCPPGAIRLSPDERARSVRVRAHEPARASLPRVIGLAGTGIDRVHPRRRGEIEAEKAARAKRSRISPIARIRPAIQERRDEAAIANGEPCTTRDKVTAPNHAWVGNENARPGGRPVGRFIAICAEDEHPRPRHAEPKDQRAHGRG